MPVPAAGRAEQREARLAGEAPGTALRLTVLGPEQSGVRFRHRAGAEGLAKRFMIECVGAGLGLIDVDDDGDLDLYLVQGGDVAHDGSVVRGPASADALFLNDGTGRFRAAGSLAGALGSGFGSGVFAGDVDGDGDEDLLVTNLGPNELLLNDPGSAGRFTRAPAAAGLAGPPDAWSTGAAFADVDGDGDLDVYVANYLAHDLAHPLLSGAPCTWMGCRVPCGPQGLTPQPDALYLNDGDGRFTEVTTLAGLGAVPAAYAFQAVFTDVDGDGDPDLFVANDSVANGFYLHDGLDEHGLPRFVDQSLRSGLALSAAGKAQAGMGVAVADLDGDLRDDLLLTNFARETNAAYCNLSSGDLGALFFDEAGALGLGQPSWMPLGWGVCALDADLDGDRDLFVANGHVYPHVGACGLQMEYEQPDQLFEQVAPRRFREAAAVPGGALPAASSRGAAAGDLDGDGDVDLAVSVLDGEPLLLLNESAAAGRWIVLDLRPVAGSVGAQVLVHDGVRTQVAEVRRGSSFLCTEDRRLHFGVASDAEGVDVVVRWRCGAREAWTGLQPGRVVRLVRGEGASPGSGEQAEEDEGGGEDR